MDVINRRIEQEERQGRFLYKLDEFLDTEVTLGTRVTATVNVWISASILLISCIFYIVAFATLGWGVAISTSSGDTWIYGLWSYCGPSANCEAIAYHSSAFLVCQVFSCMALVSLFLSMMLLILYCVFDHMKRVPSVRLGAVFSRFVNWLCLLLTFSIYAGSWSDDKFTFPEYNTSLSYSYALTVTTFCLECMASILMAIETKNQSEEILLRERERAQQRHDERGRINSSYDSNEHQVVTSPYETFMRFSETGDGEDGAVDSKYNQYSSNDSNTNRDQFGLHNETQAVKPKRYIQDIGEPEISYNTKHTANNRTNNYSGDPDDGPYNRTSYNSYSNSRATQLMDSYAQDLHVQQIPVEIHNESKNDKTRNSQPSLENRNNQNRNSQPSIENRNNQNRNSQPSIEHRNNQNGNSQPSLVTKDRNYPKSQSRNQRPTSNSQHEIYEMNQIKDGGQLESRRHMRSGDLHSANGRTSSVIESNNDYNQQANKENVFYARY